MQLRLDRKYIVAIVGGCAALLCAGAFFYLCTSPRTATELPVRFSIQKGEGFMEIAARLHALGIIRSRIAFTAYGILSRSTNDIKPGVYELSAYPNVPSLFATLVRGAHREIRAVVPEGASLYDIDRIMSELGVLQKGDVIAANFEAISRGDVLEGTLFPDTYNFFTDSDAPAVVKKMRENFEHRLSGLLPRDAEQSREILTLASLIQNEVPEFEDQRMVAGVLRERLRIGMPLQVDASICYIKEAGSLGAAPCYPLTDLDFRIDSPYNTYLYNGLPPNPIGNPGIFAVKAALEPKSSPYLYYLSDPETGKTVFAKTFEEHKKNRARYLRNR